MSQAREGVPATGASAPREDRDDDDGGTPVEYQPESGATGAREAPSEAQAERDPRDDI